MRIPVFRLASRTRIVYRTPHRAKKLDVCPGLCYDRLHRGNNKSVAVELVLPGNMFTETAPAASVAPPFSRKNPFP
ncbi:MAG TPA: hypothetical protein VGH00_00530, partial [Chthoniobacterales bacterium]